LFTLSNQGTDYLYTYSVVSEDSLTVTTNTATNNIVQGNNYSYCAYNQNLLLLDTDNLQIDYRSTKACTEEKTILTFPMLGITSVIGSLQCNGQYAQLVGTNGSASVIINFNLDVERNYDSFIHSINTLTDNTATSVITGYKTEDVMVNVISTAPVRANESNSVKNFNTQILFLNGPRIFVPAQTATPS
jgi:hypothetical protein